MASFARINGDRLFELRAGNGNNCRYDEFIQRLTDLAKADIKFEHDYLQSAVEAAAQEFSERTTKEGHQRLVTNALARIVSEKSRIMGARGSSEGRSPGSMYIKN